MSVQKEGRSVSTAAEWTVRDPVLSGGWIGIEGDTGRYKRGDGVTEWTLLGYADDDAVVDAYATLGRTSAPASALKYHRVTPMTFATPDVWVPVEYEAAPADEQLPGLDLLADNITVESSITDLLFVSGCTRPLWSGGNNGDAILASRIMTADDGVNFTENRCLQAISSRGKFVNEVGVMHYLGTTAVVPGTRFRLEVLVSDTDLSLTGSAVFDNPVSVSIQAFSIGRLSWPI